MKMVVIVNQITLLQFAGNSVSNDTRFVMVRYIVSKPFNKKCLLEQTVVSLSTLGIHGKSRPWRKRDGVIVN